MSLDSEPTVAKLTASDRSWPKASNAVIRAAALQLFWKRGFHGTSVRQIAAAAELPVANTYHYYPSKVALLYEIVDQTTDRLAEVTLTAAQSVPNDPVERLRAIVGAHVRFHIDYQRESFLGNSEMRSLPDHLLKQYVAKRDAQEARFREVVEAGARSGDFRVRHTHEVVLAMVTMCTSISLWYRQDGPLQPQQIVERFQQIALSMVGVVED